MNSVKQTIWIHDKPITDLKFHPDGDLFFAGSKDTSASVTNLKGCVLGTFDKHVGAISTIAVKDNTLVTAGLDLTYIQWDVITGSPTSILPTDSIIRGLDFNEQIYFCTDNSMNKTPILGFCDPRTNKMNTITQLNDPATKVFKFNETVIVSTKNGKILKFDVRNNQFLMEAKPHQDRIGDMKPSACRSFFITASTDSSSKIIDSETFVTKKTFNTEDPINSACIFHKNDKVVCAGGINARDVTTTKGKGTFNTNFFDIVTQENIGSYNTHFGTINCLDIHPKGNYCISGGEEGFICLIKFGTDFYNAPFTNFDE